MPKGNPAGYLSAAWAGTYGYGGAITTAGSSAIMDYTTDINPLLEITPSPFEGAMYGFATLNPLEGMRRFGMAFTGGKFEYGGAWGYKTLMTGVKPSLWSNLSLGNVVLSGMEVGARGIGAAFDIADDPTIKMMSQARKVGLAGIFGKVDKVPGTGKNYKKVLSAKEIADIKAKIRSRWAGPKYLTSLNDFNVEGYNKAVKASLKAAARNKTSTVKAATGLTSLMYWLGGETAAGGKAMVNVGGKGVGIMAGIGGRLAAGLSGIGTAWLLYDVSTMLLGDPIDAAEAGVTDLATGLLQWQKEIVKPDFGTGRIHQAMSSAGAGTERRRAIQASYSARINPGNRMFGNEARYHHSR